MGLIDGEVAIRALFSKGFHNLPGIGYDTSENSVSAPTNAACAGGAETLPTLTSYTGGRSFGKENIACSRHHPVRPLPPRAARGSAYKDTDRAGAPSHPCSGPSRRYHPGCLHSFPGGPPLLGTDPPPSSDIDHALSAARRRGSDRRSGLANRSPGFAERRVVFSLDYLRHRGIHGLARNSAFGPDFMGCSASFAE